MKVMININLSEEQIEKVKSISSNIKVIVARNYDEQRTNITDTDVVLGGVSRDLFLKAEKLRWIHVPSAGVDGVIFPELVSSNVILTSMKGHVGIHLADHAMALLLALIRGIHTALRNPRWETQSRIRENALELIDKTMGIIGFGGTGFEVAKRAKAFGMEIIALEPENVQKPDFVKVIWKPERFYDLLECSDVVTICAPLTDFTYGMFNLEAFHKMKRSAILINVTRGQIIDEKALMKALEEGLISAVGLDVTPNEPIPSDNPLWNMDNVIITPHTSGGSPARIDRTVELFCDNLTRFLANQPLLSVIDKTKGY
jgi:phosphoglycerate dehydrogenase-like enzyme